MHMQTVGMDCARCHTPHSWIVKNITDIHRQSRFPLQGPHLAAQCLECHPSASLLRFEPVGVECIDCHMQDYQSASDPNHPVRIYPLIVWNAIPQALAGNLLNSGYMTRNFSLYTPERIRGNGALAQTVTRTRPPIQFFPASIAMNTTGQKWMMSTQMKGDMNIPARPVWIATQQERETKRNIFFMPVILPESYFFLQFVCKLACESSKINPFTK